LAWAVRITLRIDGHVVEKTLFRGMLHGKSGRELKV
jgi:hypothetical protein